MFYSKKYRTSFSHLSTAVPAHASEASTKHSKVCAIMIDYQLHFITAYRSNQLEEHSWRVYSKKEKEKENSHTACTVHIAYSKAYTFMSNAGFSSNAEAGLHKVNYFSYPVHPVCHAMWILIKLITTLHVDFQLLCLCVLARFSKSKGMATVCAV